MIKEGKRGGEDGRKVCVGEDKEKLYRFRARERTPG